MKSTRIAEAQKLLDKINSPESCIPRDTILKILQLLIDEANVLPSTNLINRSIQN